VLILGGGDGMALREVLKYDDVTDVTLVDIDPDMIELARTNDVLRRLNDDSLDDARVYSDASEGVVDTGQMQNVLLDTGEVAAVECNETISQGQTTSQCVSERILQKVATVNVFTIDADRFISEPRQLYDVVIVDLPDPNSVELAKLYSVEFYQKIQRILSPNGIVAVQSTSPYHAKETFLCIMRTMSAAGFNVVPYHDNVPSFGDWGWNMGSPTLTAEALYERADGLESFGVSTREVGANNMTRALIFNNGALTSESTEISSLMRPVVFDYYLYEAWKVG
jgi:spermidine synthase